MSRIERIKAIKGHRIFGDYAWPEELPAFGKYNLIYGANGTGKTTLSRLFRALERRESVDEGRVIFEVDGRAILGAEFNRTSVPLHVFNRDFVRDSVFTTGDVLEPIIVLGSTNIERQQELERLRERQAALTEALRTERSDLTGTEGGINTLGTSTAARIKEALRNLPTYLNYDRRNFIRRVEAMASAGDRDRHRVSDEAIATLRTQANAREKARLASLQSPAEALSEATRQVTALLARSVVVEAIEQLSSDSELESWVHTGLAVHRGRSAADCLFCGESLDSDRIAALERHFNAEYEILVRDIDDAITGLEGIQERLRDTNLPHQEQFLDGLASEFAAIESNVRDAVAAARLRVAALKDLLVAKKRNPLQSSVLPDEMSALRLAAFDDAIALVDRHNETCEDLATARTDAAERYESAVVEAALDAFVRLAGEREELDAAIARNETELQTVDAEISEIEQARYEHFTAAENLNEDLARYLGHDEITLSVKETGYAVSRRGEATKTLSEGEQTAVALLYFLQSLKRDGFDRTNGIVVLDDPVSSLDSGALYLALGLIQARTRDVGQVFILTHNFTFFRQARRWMDRAEGPDRYYMLECESDAGQRVSRLGPLNPLLRRYESDYHYLFARVARAAAEPNDIPLDEHYGLPNMARRLMESFLAFKRPLDRDVFKALEGLPFEDERKNRIVRFLNASSHADGAIGDESDATALTESTAVLTDLIELMERTDPDHVRFMREAVARYAQGNQ